MAHDHLARAETKVGGTVAVSTTWTLAGSPYVVEDHVWVQGAGGPVLTIEPGVEVRVAPGRQIAAGYASPGELKAIGTVEKPIVFTAAGTVKAGWWQGLLFGAHSGASRLEQAVVEGGGEAWTAGIRISGSAPTLREVTVRTSSHQGIRVEGGAPEVTRCTVSGTTGGEGTGLYAGSGARPTLRDVTIRDCSGSGVLAMGGARPRLEDVVIRGNGRASIEVGPGAEPTGLTGLVLEGNGQDGVRHRGGTLGANETWKSFGYPYHIVDDHVWIQGAVSPVLTIEPGVEVRVAPGRQIAAGHTSPGELRAVGTVEKPIVFTTAGAVGAGKWLGLLLGRHSGASRLEQAVVEGGGEAWTAGIRISGSAPTLRDVTVRTSSHQGIRVEGGAPEITRCTVSGTTGGEGTGLYAGSGARPTLRDVTIRDCSGSGVVAMGGARPHLEDVVLRGNGRASIEVGPGAEPTGLTGLVLEGNGQDGVRHRGGTLGANETWKSFGYPYYVVDDHVWIQGAVSPVLTIEPGVEVRVAPGRQIAAGHTSPGELQAIGTVEKPIVFTAAGTVGAGKWLGLLLGPHSGASRLEQAVVEGGGEAWTAGIRISGSAPTLREVTVRTSSHQGIRVEGGAPEVTRCTVSGTAGGEGTGLYAGSGARPTLRDVTIRDCSGSGVVAMGGARPRLEDVVIRGNGRGAIEVGSGAEPAGLTGLVLEGNGQDGVRHRGGTIGADETWRSFGYPYYLVDDHVWVQGTVSPVLTIEPGVEVRVAPGRQIAAGHAAPGELKAIGTVEKPIVFTAAGTVKAGWWQGLLFGTHSGASRLEHAVVEGGGEAWTAGIRISGSEPTLRDVTVRTSSHQGIRVEGGAPEVTRCTVSGTAGGEGTGISLSQGTAARIASSVVTSSSGAGLRNSGSRAELRFVTLTGNGGEGLHSTAGELRVRNGAVTGQPVPVRNADPASRVVDARQQWWGDEKGPAGLAGRVEFEPWLGSPPTPDFAVASLECSARRFAPGRSSTRVDAELPTESDWTFLLADVAGTEVRRFGGRGAALDLEWDGTNASGSPLGDGRTTYRFEATEVQTGRAAAPLVGVLELDGALPTAVLTSPAGSVRVRAGDEVVVEGSAGGPAFQEYVIEAGPGEFPATWTLVDRGTRSVTGGRLGTWTTALLPEGRYTLRLTVRGGPTSVAVVTSRVELVAEESCR